LLRCAEAAGDLPLGHFFAAETVCFLEFSSYLGQTDTLLGRAALRVLHRVLEGLRCGIQPQIVAEGRLGELVERLWEERPGGIDPLAVRVFHEALRLLRRAPHAEDALAGDTSEQEAFTWQVSHLAALEPALADYLVDAPAALRRGLSRVPPVEHLEWLRALADLRAEAADVLLPLLDLPHYAHAELAVNVLRWSQDPRVGPWLRDWAHRNVPMARRAQRRRQVAAGRSFPPDGFPYRALLRALRGHGSAQTEAFLLLAVRDWDPTIRTAALASLGWWEPYSRPEVLLSLHDARRDPSGDVRQAARAALARLGERQTLQWFRQGLTSEETQRVLETVHVVASEGLTLLWPDLDRLADSEDQEVAHHAREALEGLGEDLERPWA
jgi:hypothetical protein